MYTVDVLPSPWILLVEAPAVACLLLSANANLIRYKYIFQYPLPIPPVLPPATTYTNTTTGKTTNFYEIEIKAFDAQTYPNLGKTSYVGYNGIAPGPTIMNKKGEDAVVRFINKYDRPSSIHLHGSYSRTPFDGWADDVTNPGRESYA